MEERRRPRPMQTLRMLALLCLAMMALAAGCQHYEREPRRAVSGTVTDYSHEPLRGAVVQIEMEGTMTIQSFVTDERGIFHFHNLSPDADYTLWANFRGRQSQKENLSKFDHQADRVFHLIVRPAKD